MRLILALLALCILPAAQTWLCFNLPVNPIEYYFGACCIGFVFMAVGLRAVVKWALG